MACDEAEGRCTDDMAAIAFLADLFNSSDTPHVHINIASVGSDTVISITCKDVN